MNIKNQSTAEVFAHASSLAALSGKTILLPPSKLLPAGASVRFIPSPLRITAELLAFNSSAALHAIGTTTASAGNNFVVTADNRLFVGNYEFTLEEQEADEAREMCEQEDLTGLNRLFNALYLEQSRISPEMRI